MVASFALAVAMLSIVASVGAQAPTGSSPADPPSVLIAYASRSGATAAMAEAVAAGASEVATVRVTRKRVSEVTDADLLAADAIIVGTPVHNAGPSGEVKAFIDGWPFERLKNKIGAAFAAAGGTSAGEELTTTSLLHAMLIFQFVVVGGESWQAAFGATAITEEGKPAAQVGQVDAAAKEKARGLGRRVATLARALAATGWTRTPATK